MPKKLDLVQVLYDQVSARENLVQYEIPKERSRKIISWYLIHKDISEMIDCINYAFALSKAQPLNYLVISAIWEKMLISYGKIFSSSKDGFSTLNRNMLDQADIGLHDKLISIRNSHLAHRGDNDYEHYILVAGLVGCESNCKIEFLVPGITLKGHYDNPVLVRRYLKRLKKKVGKQLAHMNDKLEQELYADLGLEPLSEIFEG